MEAHIDTAAEGRRSEVANRGQAYSCWRTPRGRETGSRWVNKPVVDGDLDGRPARHPHHATDPAFRSKIRTCSGKLSHQAALQHLDDREPSNPAQVRACEVDLAYLADIR